MSVIEKKLDTTLTQTWTLTFVGQNYIINRLFHDRKEMMEKRTQNFLLGNLVLIWLWGHLLEILFFSPSQHILKVIKLENGFHVEKMKNRERKHLVCYAFNHTYKNENEVHFVWFRVTLFFGLYDNEMLSGYFIIVVELSPICCRRLCRLIRVKFYNKKKPVLQSKDQLFRSITESHTFSLC